MDTLIKTKEEFKNATFVLAGAACLLFIISLLHSDGFIPIKGIWTLFPLALPLLGFWYGMFFRQISSNPKWWVRIIVTLAAAFLLVKLATDQVFYEYTNALRTLLFVMLGFVVPIETGDNGESSLKTGALVLLSVLAYTISEFSFDRINVAHMAEGYQDTKEMMSNVLKFGIWAPTFLAVWFSAKFSFSGAGQWLGSRNWFRWISSIAMVYVFIYRFGELFMWWLEWWMILDILFQPVTVYLGIVFYRLTCNRISGKEIKKYENVFKI